MGVQLPRKSRELLALRGVTAVRRSTRASWWWIAGLLAVLSAYLPILAARPDPAHFVVMLWGLVPFSAAVGWGYAARGAEARARTAFLALQLAAIAAVVAHLLCTYGVATSWASALPTSDYLLPIPHVLLALGSALLLGAHRGKTWTPRLAADSLLLMLAALAAALRLLVEPSLAAGPAPEGDRLILALLQSVTLVSVVLAAQLVLRRGTPLAPWAASLLLAATLTFALAALVSMTGLYQDTGEPGAYIELAGWLLFAGSAFSARLVPATTHAMFARRRAPDAVRKLIVPGTAVFLAVAVADIGLGRPARPETVFVVSLLAVVLAARTAQAFNLADRDAQRRRQLAHTRALVDVTHALAGTTDLDETLRVISESARRVFGTKGAGIELLTEDGTALETRSAVGLPGEVLGLRFPLEGSFTGWVVKHQEPRATVDPSRDPYIQPQSLSFLGHQPVAAAPIHFRGETLGALFACIRSEPFDPEELELMGALAEQAAIAIQQARLFEQVTVLSITDPLTGLANRRRLERELDREFAAARRGRDLTAVIFDLDSFKAYNDTYGHLAGDEALQAFGEALQQESRAMNLVARYGGDEFVAILSDTDVVGARAFVRRVERRFHAAVEALGRGRVSVSAGMAQFQPEMEQPEELLRAADDELYRVKPKVRA